MRPTIGRKSRQADQEELWAFVCLELDTPGWLMNSALVGDRSMAGRTLVRRSVSRAMPASSTTIPRPHYLDRPRSSEEAKSSSSPPVKLHTDDWMQVELPRGDYLMAGLVALSIAVAVGSFVLLPAILFFNWLPLASSSFGPSRSWLSPWSPAPSALGLAFAAPKAIASANASSTNSAIKPGRSISPGL